LGKPACLFFALNDFWSNNISVGVYVVTKRMKELAEEWKQEMWENSLEYLRNANTGISYGRRKTTEKVVFQDHLLMRGR